MKSKIAIVLTTSLLSTNIIFIQPTFSQIAPPSQSKGESSPSLKEYIDSINSQLDVIDKAVGEFLGNWTSIFQLIPIDQGLIRDANALSSLVSRLMKYPSEVSGWWDIITNTAKSEYNSCASVVSSMASGQVSAFVPDPDWCIFARQQAVDENGNPVTSMPGSYGHSNSTGPFGNPIGKKTETRVTSTSDMSEVIKDSMGVAGVPLLSRLRYKAFQEVENGNYIDNYITSKQVKNDFARSAVERSFASLRSESILSDQGQIAQQKTGEALTEATAVAVSATRSALASNVTQDVMKGVAQAGLQNTMVLGSMASMQQRQINDNAVQSLQLNNISRSLDAQKRQRYTERSAALSSMIYRVSQAGLF